ncbi:MAG: DUF871 domain-containing protein [Culicoidibacterales bacterium]
MKRRLGISIYPEHSIPTDIKNYIDLAAKYGYERIFTCLLSVDKPVEEVKAEFKDIIMHARTKNMEVILDVAPRVFEDLGIDLNDLKFFAEIGATGIRLDEGFNSAQEAMMTFNKYGLDIEVNMSNDVAYVDNIMTYKPNQAKLIGCHNFYPQQFCGLEYNYFLSCSERFKSFGMRTAAFVSSPSATIGPWSVMDGLSTLEMHRTMPIDVQAKHLWATGLIDDVIIGNMFATEEELAKLAELDPYKLTLKVDFSNDSSALEKDIVLNFEHFRRGDLNEYMVRSTMSRVVYKAEDFPVHDVQALSKGDLVIGNDDFGMYKGEMQLVLKEMPLDARKNVVAKIVEEEHFLIDFIGSWDKFALIENK